MWIYKNQVSKIVDFEIIGDDDMRIHLDKELLMTEGKELIRKLLLTLQTFKSSGCVERGAKFYNEYSEVSDYFLKFRDIVQKTKLPRRLELNNNLVRFNETHIEPVVYPECFEGVIMSWRDRFPFTKHLYKQVTEIWNEHKESMKVKV